ncbi:hypothetical protein B7463_g3498, partial [Scytalidium lignicola]
MQKLAILTAIFVAAPSISAYSFTTCNKCSTGTGCGGTPTSWTVSPGDTQNVPGTQCVIWPANGEAASWQVCNGSNGGRSCTSGTNINCFAAEDGSGRIICNTAGTQSIKILT